MTQQLPSAQIRAVKLRGSDPPQCVGRVTVLCPFCTQLHAHRVFTNDPVQFTRTAPCSTEHDVRSYRVDLGVHRREASQPRPVYESGEDLNDNAIDLPVPNWEE